MKLATAILIVLILAAAAVCHGRPYYPPQQPAAVYQQPAGVWVAYPRPTAIGNGIWGPFWVFYPIHRCPPQQPPQQPAR